MKTIICLISLIAFNTIIAAETDDFVITIKSDNPGGSPTEFRIKALGACPRIETYYRKPGFGAILP